jgi:hypothetical protein
VAHHFSAVDLLCRSANSGDEPKAAGRKKNSRKPEPPDPNHDRTSAPTPSSSLSSGDSLSFSLRPDGRYQSHPALPA